MGDLKAVEPSSDRLHPLIKLPGIIILVGATFVVVFGILIPTGIIPLEGKMTTLTAINQTFMPVGLWVNGRGLRTSRPLETWTSKDPSNIFSDNDKTTYTFKGYKFIPGMGNLFGWQEDGTNVYGEEGKLVFAKPTPGMSSKIPTLPSPLLSTSRQESLMTPQTRVLRTTKGIDR
jgi:hypothetical protein